MRQIEEELSLPYEVFALLSVEKPLCTLDDLQCLYDLNGMYDLLEIQEAKNIILEEQQKELEKEYGKK